MQLILRNYAFVLRNYSCATSISQLVSRIAQLLGWNTMDYMRLPGSSNGEYQCYMRQSAISMDKPIVDDWGNQTGGFLKQGILQTNPPECLTIVWFINGIYEIIWIIQLLISMTGWWFQTCFYHNIYWE